MKYRIDFEAMIEDPLHWVRLTLYVGMFAALMIPLGAGLDALMHRKDVVRATLPPVTAGIVAGGIRVEEGVAAFRGEPQPRVRPQQTAEILVTLVVSGLLLPALFFWGIRKRAEWHLKPGSRGLRARITVAVTVGGFSLLLMLGSIPLVFVARDTDQTIRRDNRISSARDLLTTESCLMATRARMLYFLPARRGGMGGAWMTRDGSRRQLIRLEDIRLPPPPQETRFEDSLPATPGTFVLEVVNADSLVIWGIGSEKNGEGDTLLNKDGQRGMIQIHVGVTPDRTALISAID